MSVVIAWEWGFFLTSMFCGMFLCGIYDCIRVFRRIVIHHTQIWIFVEDILFWLYGAMVIFKVAYLMNDGIIRGFSLMGFVLGALIYHMATYGWLVKNVVKLLLFLFRPLKMLREYIRITVHKAEERRKDNAKVRDKAGQGSKDKKTKTL